MTKRTALTRLVGIVLVAMVFLGVTIAQGHSPFLGLDLQGGVSVVLRAKTPDRADALSRVADALNSAGESIGIGPVTAAVVGDTVVVTPTTPQTDDALDQAKATVATLVEDAGLGDESVSVSNGTIVVTFGDVGVSDSSIDQAIEIIRNRVDAIGVAEPEITRQGNNVVVQIPGVKDPDAALDLVGRTAELRFRPVLGAIDPAQLEEGGSTTTTAPTGESTTTTAPTGDSTTTIAGETTTTVAAGETTTTTAAGGSGRSASRRAQDPTTTTTPDATTATDPTATDPTATDPTATDPTATDPTATDPTATDPTATSIDPTATTVPPVITDPTAVTPDDEDKPDVTVILPGRDGLIYQLGPTLLTGAALSGASAQLSPDGEWTVVVNFRSGPDGNDLFNAAAAQCSPPSATCPTGQLAIVLDHEVISAPVIQQSSFDGSAVISGGEGNGFTEQEAKDLALVLRYGALPVELEAQTTVRVSATLGSDALHAALVSGAIALVLVTVYMLALYRLLGLLAIAKLAVELALLWSLISYLGETQGLALTLAGITGIIVSIGVSLDSNIVYYEHLKEDVIAGRTLRATVDRSFDSAYSTIVKADVASLIGAGLLWWLTVGPVRGFAFYLGVSTLLDLICAWFFMHPAVALATRSHAAQTHPRRFGMPDAPIVDGRPGTGRRREAAQEDSTDAEVVP